VACHSGVVPFVSYWYVYRWPLGARHGHGQWVHDVNLGRYLEIILGKDHRTILYNLPDALTYHLGLLYMDSTVYGTGHSPLQDTDIGTPLILS
jgi:hypothetical protein